MGQKKEKNKIKQEIIDLKNKKEFSQPTKIKLLPKLHPLYENFMSEE